MSETPRPWQGPHNIFYGTYPHDIRDAKGDSIAVFRSEEAATEALIAVNACHELDIAPENLVERFNMVLEFSKSLSSELRELREGLEDFRDHGTRHDLNPTLLGSGVHGEEGMTPGGRGWHSYLQQMDRYVRNRARALLKKHDD